MEKCLLEIFPTSIRNIICEYSRIRVDFASELCFVTQLINLDNIDDRNITSERINTRYWYKRAGASHMYYYKRWPKGSAPKKFETVWTTSWKR